MKSTARLLVVLGGLFALGAARAEDSPLRVTELDVCEDIVDRTCRGGDKSFSSELQARKGSSARRL